MTFPLWFSQAEQVLRYHAVKRNAFAFEPDLPERLLAGSDPYLAYLLQNLLPGTPGIRPKSAARMLSTEGVIAALMYRWMQRAPLEDGYRKLFRAMELHQPHTMAELIAAYQRAFPEEAAAIDALVRETLAGQALPAAPEIWLANPDFHTGSTVFDQFRSVPRTHTFDLNAASVVDLAGVPGVSHAQAEAILKSAPYARLGDLRVTPELMNRFRRMAAEMEKLRVDKDKMETELPFQTILLSFVWRALGGVALAAAFGAVLYRLVRRVRWWRAALNGLGAALVAMPAAWMGASPWFALLFAVPAVLWQLGRYRAWCPTLRVLLAWIAAAIPAVALVRPWLD
jgi:DNA uptake protein ComE-like DNA-binding protein